MTSLTRKLFCACVLILVAVGIQPAPASSALLCGNRWVDTNYVLPNNCMKACLNAHHTVADCTTSLVPLCQSCWRGLLSCAGFQNIAPAEHCRLCTDRYALSMKTFF